jgi:hypothetical protein
MDKRLVLYKVLTETFLILKTHKVQYYAISSNNNNNNKQ